MAAVSPVPKKHEESAMGRSIENTLHWEIKVVLPDTATNDSSVCLEIRKGGEPDSDPVVNVRLSVEERLILAGALLLRESIDDEDEVFSH
jgi:hypothetical protein